MSPFYSLGKSGEFKKLAKATQLGVNPGSLDLEPTVQSLALCCLHMAEPGRKSRCCQLPSRGLGVPPIPPPSVCLKGTPASPSSLPLPSHLALCSFPACTAPRGTAPTPGSCPTWWLCAWPPSTPATKSSSTGQSPPPRESLGGTRLPQGR